MNALNKGPSYQLQRRISVHHTAYDRIENIAMLDYNSNNYIFRNFYVPSILQQQLLHQRGASIINLLSTMLRLEAISA